MKSLVCLATVLMLAALATQSARADAWGVGTNRLITKSTDGGSPALVTMNRVIQETASFGTGSVLRVPQDFATIAAALAAATADDAVLIDCGTYYEHTLEVPSGVMVISVTGQPDCVTIDPGQEGVGVFIVDGDATTVLKGITVTNARAPGGAALRGQGSPTILDCTFVGNNTLGQFAGGGAVNLEGAPRFENCKFDNNQASSGGAVTCFGGEFINCMFSENTAGDLDGGAIDGDVALIDGCTFKFNYAYLNGGAVYGCVDVIRGTLFWNNGVASHFGTGGGASLTCDALVENCTFYGNSTNTVLQDTGGAALALFGPTLVTHSIFANNNSGEAADVGSIACLGNADVDVLCTNIHGTIGVAGDWVGCIAAMLGTDGNISEDPLFCDAANGDFSLASTSPSLTASCGRQGAFEQGCTAPTAINNPLSPSKFYLYENVPNPFNPITRIRFDVPEGGANLEIVVYDVIGRKVRVIANGRIGEGAHEVTWDGRDDDGQAVRSGIYFCRLRGESIVQTRKMLLLK